MIVQQMTYEVTDPTIDSQLVALKASGADVFLDITTPKFAAMAIRKVAEIGWKPMHFLASVSQSIAAVLKPAGLENAKGVISCEYLRDPSHPDTKASAEFKEYEAWFRKYYPGGDINDVLNVIGYSSAQTLHHVLKTAGDNLTRENILKIATNLDLRLPMLQPGIQVKTSLTDYYPVAQMIPVQFDGQIYQPIGPAMGR
jgi:ABC-type branched-subunit amino acid transport system substrate-binding protein